MKPILLYILVAIFAIFIGSQITESALLVPYWQSLSAKEFYTYYNKFGHSIGSFYTILTIIAALIPMLVIIYINTTKTEGLKFAIISALFAILFMSTFYIYFKGVNDLFFNSILDEVELKNKLVVWSYWHLGRIVLECFSLLFLILAFTKSQNSNNPD